MHYHFFIESFSSLFNILYTYVRLWRSKMNSHSLKLVIKSWSLSKANVGVVELDQLMIKDFRTSTYSLTGFISTKQSFSTYQCANPSSNKVSLANTLFGLGVVLLFCDCVYQLSHTKSIGLLGSSNPIRPFDHQNFPQEVQNLVIRSEWCPSLIQWGR